MQEARVQSLVREVDPHATQCGQKKKYMAQFFFFFWLCYSGIKPVPPALEAQSLNHWPLGKSLNPKFICQEVLYYELKFLNSYSTTTQL